MVTISEDFLNSLPADKRAEFLNATFEMLSMNPSDQDEIMAQNIRRLYEGHQGKVIKCSFCRKDEPDDQEFGHCAGCGLVQYCSKECQKRHWKQHKVECGKCDISFKKLGWRMDQFGHFYNPLIHKLVLDMHRFYNKEMDTGDVLFPEDVIVEIQLADLPRSAKRPRLYIKKVFLAKLSMDEVERAYSHASLPEPGYTHARYCLAYNYGENENFFSHYQFHHRVGPAERSNFARSSKQLYDENVGEHCNMINSIAKGENPKVYKLIKGIIRAEGD